MSGNHYACPDCGSWEGYMHRLNCAARDTLVVRPKADREAIAAEWSKPYKNGKPRAVFKRFSLYPMKRKPLSPRRANEFRERELKKFYGDRRERTARHEYIRIKCIYLPFEMLPAWVQKRAWLKKQVRHLSGAALEAAIS